MIYGVLMLTGDECGPNFLTFVLRLRGKPRKNLNLEIDPAGDQTRARYVRGNGVPIDHSGNFSVKYSKLTVLVK